MYSSVWSYQGTIFVAILFWFLLCWIHVINTTLSHIGFQGTSHKPWYCSAPIITLHAWESTYEPICFSIFTNNPIVQFHVLMEIKVMGVIMRRLTMRGWNNKNIILILYSSQTLWGPPGISLQTNQRKKCLWNTMLHKLQRTEEGM